MIIPRRVRLGLVSENGKHPVLRETEKQLANISPEKGNAFPSNWMPKERIFQNQVWQALRTIPYGETRSYGQIAAQIGNARAMRAVGAANGKNPISIIVPCHRVIGASGHLTGFAGGLDVKEQLLSLEGNQDAKKLKTKTTRRP